MGYGIKKINQAKSHAGVYLLLTLIVRWGGLEIASMDSVYIFEGVGSELPYPR